MKLTHTIFVAILLAASVLTLSCCGILPDPFPSDSVMEATFNKHEAEFNRLVSMIKEDSPVDLVWPDRASAPSPNTVPNRVDVELPKERQKEYRTLFKRLGVRNMTRWRDTITLEAWENNNFVSSESKSYFYAESPPSPLVSSLEESSSTRDVSEYKHVRGNWYLHYSKSF
jgi:hypothetical protein